MTNDHRYGPPGDAQGRPDDVAETAGLPADGRPADDLLAEDLLAEDLHADDLLLDALGRGAAPPGGDPFAALLATWRADLDDEPIRSDAELIEAFCGPAAAAGTGAAEPGADSTWTVERPRPAAPATSAPGQRSDRSGPDGRRPDQHGPDRHGPDRHGPDRRGPGRHGPDGRGAGRRRAARRGPGRRGAARRGPGRRGTRLLIGVATAVVALAVLGIGANNAGPASPLWPVARLVYPEQAAVRAAEHEIDLARRAVTDRRYDRAGAHLDRAETHTAQVGDPAQAQRLRDEIARIRALLPLEGPVGAQTPAPSRPAPGGSAEPAPSAPPTDPAATATPEGDPVTPAPGTTTRPGLLPPLLPSPLLPNLPLLPSLLPSGLPLI